MTHDPVIADLNRHLNQVDRDEARGEAIDEIIEEQLKNREIVSDALADELNLPEDLHDIAVEAQLTGDWSRFGMWIEDFLREHLEEGAEEELERRIEQDKMDAAEAKAETREFYRDYD